MASTAIEAILANSSTNNSSSTKKANDGTYDSEDFMTLLMAELKNQDPMNPMSSSEMMGQIAQLNTLNTLVSIQDTLDEMNKSQVMSYGTSLIGKTISAIISEDDTTGIVSGEVSSVYMDGDTAFVTVDGMSIELSKVVEVSAE